MATACRLPQSHSLLRANADPCWRAAEISDSLWLFGKYLTLTEFQGRFWNQRRHVLRDRKPGRVACVTRSAGRSPVGSLREEAPRHPRNYAVAGYRLISCERTPTSDALVFRATAEWDTQIPR
jgi:hypothetical protein